MCDHTEKDIDILARTIWGEARGEGIEGMRAVACVILNRVKKAKKRGGDFWWGNNIQSVCLRPWQFSCWNKNDPNRDKLLRLTDEDPYFFQALKIAKEMILKGEGYDITKGSDHYHTIYIKPFWTKGMTPICQIGHHLFYKLVE